jgi:TetR/AcrR family transcriptional repressor of nem operon
MDKIFSASTPPLDRLRDFFKGVYEEQAQRHGECGAVLGCPYFTLGCEVSTQDRAICEGVKKILERYAKYFESAIRDAHVQGDIVAPNAKAKAKMLIAFFQGSLTQARIDNSVGPLRELPTGALELLGAKKQLARR